MLISCAGGRREIVEGDVVGALGVGGRGGVEGLLRLEHGGREVSDPRRVRITTDRLPARVGWPTPTVAKQPSDRGADDDRGGEISASRTLAPSEERSEFEVCIYRSPRRCGRPSPNIELVTAGSNEVSTITT